MDEDRARFRQDPQQEQEWLRQLNLIYSGLIGIGVVMIQPFLTAASLDLTAKICVVAFSVAIPLLAALVVVNRQEVFRGRATPSVLASSARVVAQASAFTGVVAGFWHILWIAGVGMLATGLDGGESPGHEEAHLGDPELDREQNQPQEQDPTLFPAGQAGGDGGLVGLVNALAVLDRRADPRPRGLVEAILEGKPPFGVASLLNHAVHRAGLRSHSWLEGEAGAGRPPRRWRGSPALQLTGSTR